MYTSAVHWLDIVGYWVYVKSTWKPIKIHISLKTYQVLTTFSVMVARKLLKEGKIWKGIWSQFMQKRNYFPAVSVLKHSQERIFWWDMSSVYTIQCSESWTEINLKINSTLSWFSYILLFYRLIHYIKFTYQQCVLRYAKLIRRLDMVWLWLDLWLVWRYHVFWLED